MRLLTIREICKHYHACPCPALDAVSLDVDAGEVVTLIGESGSGKTTLLRVINGFETPNSGSVCIGERTVVDDAIFMPPERRGVGMVFQEHALFPHLTVERNIAFGLGRLCGRERDPRVQELLDLIGLDGYEHRYPHELSGGERQRVALARALAPRPGFLLMDEPFSGMDQFLRKQMREEVNGILRHAGTAAIWVTHDTEEALSVADRVAILRAGRLQQIGTPFEIYAKPQNTYVAQFFGKTNLIAAQPVDAGYHTEFGFIEAEHGHEGSGRLMVSIRPEHIDVIPEADNTSITGAVDRINFCGHYKELILDVGSNGATTELAVNVDSEFPAALRQQLHVKPNRQKVLVVKD